MRWTTELASTPAWKQAIVNEIKNRKKNESELTLHISYSAWQKSHSGSPAENTPGRSSSRSPPDCIVRPCQYPMAAWRLGKALKNQRQDFVRKTVNPQNEETQESEGVAVQASRMQNLGAKVEQKEDGANGGSGSNPSRSGQIRHLCSQRRWAGGIELEPPSPDAGPLLERRR